jgi:hypothetical protein
MGSDLLHYRGVPGTKPDVNKPKPLVTSGNTYMKVNESEPDDLGKHRKPIDGVNDEETAMTTTDETTIIPPDLQPTQARAYSDVLDYDDAAQGDTELWDRDELARSWRAVTIFAGLMVIVAISAVWVIALFMHRDADNGPYVAHGTWVTTMPGEPAPVTTMPSVAAPVAPPSDVHSVPPLPIPGTEAPTTPAFSGHYTMTNTNPDDGYRFTEEWDVTPCGYACVDITMKGFTDEAHLVGGFWKWDAPHVTAMCRDGSKVPDAGNAHTEIDATLLRGTSHMTWTKACPGENVSDPNTNNIVLTRAAS